jgi:two-component system sensor histidine kinase VicK
MRQGDHLRAYRVAYLGNDSEAAMIIRGALEKAGLEFVAAACDSGGIKKVADFDCDLVLWDLEDSNPNEPTPLEQLRKAGFENVPVAVAVPTGQENAMAESLAQGAVDFLRKPVDEDPLPRILAALSSGQRQRRVAWANRVIEDTGKQIKGILANMADPAYVVNPGYQILYMNRVAEEIFGEGLRGGICYHVFHDREQPCEVCAKSKGTARWRSALKNGKSYRFISADIRNSEGELERLVVATDVTVDEEVRKIYKTFISNVSHDLRTPLAAIDQYADILREGLAGELNEEQKENIDVIKRSSFRLRNLIENLIEANKILSGRLTLKMERVDVGDILGLVLDHLEAQAGAKGLELEVSVPDDLPPMYADKALIARVIANIAGNSIKFTEHGIVRIKAGFIPKNGGRIMISVEDAGIGVPTKDLGKIFELFYRVEGDKVYVEEGAGLGLTISREIVRAHGGTLWTESLEGMGSAFHFTLPVHEGESGTQ